MIGPNENLSKAGPENTLNVSIALCTFNGERYLEEQLESFLTQTRPPDELIVCDDGSTDRTLTILGQFAANLPFSIRIYENERHLGIVKNFEKAISLTSGDLIFLSDQDDVWYPRKIEHMYDEFEKNSEVDLVFADAALVDEEGQSLGLNLFDIEYSEPVRDAVREGNLASILIFHNYVTGASMAFRRRILEYALPFPVKIAEMIHDGWLALIASLSSEYVFIDQPLVKYRQHELQEMGVAAVKEPGLTQSLVSDSFAESLHRLDTDRRRLGAIVSFFQSNRNLDRLVPKLEELTTPRLVEIDRRVRHYQMRSNLPSKLFERSGRVLRDAFSGNYHRFSNGTRSAIRDILNI